MQSEFACHVGLRGRLFCRVCKVEGNVEGADDDEDPGPARSEGNAGDTSDAGSVNSDASVEGGTKKSKGKRTNKQTETMAEMIQRIKNFMTVSARISSFFFV